MQPTHTTTDPTVHDLDLTATLPTSPDPSSAPSGPRSRRTRRLVVAAVAVALAAAGIGAVAARGGSSSSPARAGATSPVTGVPGAAAQTVDAPLDQPADQGADQPADQPADQGAEPQPEPQPEPPAPPAEPGVLAVSTSAIWLFEGDYDGSFTVRNDGGSPIDWTFAGGVGVSQSGGTLASGESTVVSFTIDPFSLPEGPFVILNQVTSGDSVKGITIHGVRTPIVVNPGLPLLDLD